MGKKKKEKQRKRVSVDWWAYNGFFRRNHRRITFVGDSVDDSVGESVTSLYGYISLNPLVIPSVKSSDVTTPLHISKQTVYLVGETVGTYRRNIFVGRYRRVYSVGIYRQILRRNFSVDNMVYITDGKILSVIPLVFSGFLVVRWNEIWKGFQILFKRSMTIM
jgi:hypothetical protein